MLNRASYCIGLMSVYLLSSHAYAEIFKCRDGDGKVLYSEVPCASDTREEAIAVDSFTQFETNESDSLASDVADDVVSDKQRLREVFEQTNREIEQRNTEAKLRRLQQSLMTLKQQFEEDIEELRRQERALAQPISPSEVRKRERIRAQIEQSKLEYREQRQRLEKKVETFYADR